MKKIKLKHDKASILKLTMFFIICDECHIKDELIMKTANLMAKYVSVNIYHISISETSINMNLKSIKPYSDSMPWNNHWWKGFEACPYLNETVNKPWMKHERRYLYNCTSECINVFQKNYIFIIRSKEERLHKEKKMKHKIKHYITQLCMGYQNNTIWFNKTPVLSLRPHWDIMIDIQLSMKYLKFLNKNYNYVIKQSIQNVRRSAAVWVTNNKIKKRLSVKISFVTAVHILWMNLLTLFKEINQQYIRDEEAPYK